ncbi:MAG: alpha/beta fold hydrolase, partial [Pseudomonadales bacterium]|nr:alpha/beta fold hydrolase [Pseudomonadales bacterium]
MPPAYPAPFPPMRFVDSNGIRMGVADVGTGTPVVFAHGFPELAWSWRFQLPALAAEGYRAIAPDQRGYGVTDRPQAV